MRNAATTGRATRKSTPSSRMDRVRQRQPHALEYELASGQILSVQYTPIIEGGLVLAYADITARKRAEQEVARKEAQLRVALDNMPGALAYTDENLNIVVCNDRYAEMYRVPRELFSRDGPIPTCCATWPSTATTATAMSTRSSPRGWRACAIRPANVRGPPARRPHVRGVSAPAPHRRHGDGDHGHHGAQARRGDSRARRRSSTSRSTTCRGARLHRRGISTSSSATIASPKCIRCRGAAAAGTPVSGLPALSGRAWLLRRRRCRRAGREPGGKLAQSLRQALSRTTRRTATSTGFTAARWRPAVR